MLERFMKLSICQDLNLDGDYTNHLIRATVISTLYREGFEGRHIIALSANKSESTVKQHATKCPKVKRKQMFDSLSNPMKNPKTPCTEPSSVPQQNSTKTNETELYIIDVKQNLPSFNLELLNDFDTIDNELLAQLVHDEHDKTTPKDSATDEKNKNVENKEVSIPNQSQTNQYNMQVINQNNPMYLQGAHFPCIPPMYFPKLKCNY